MEDGEGQIPGWRGPAGAGLPAGRGWSRDRVERSRALIPGGQRQLRLWSGRWPRKQGEWSGLRNEAGPRTEAGEIRVQLGQEMQTGQDRHSGQKAGHQRSLLQWFQLQVQSLTAEGSQEGQIDRFPV